MHSVTCEKSSSFEINFYLKQPSVIRVRPSPKKTQSAGAYALVVVLPGRSIVHVGKRLISSCKSAEYVYKKTEWRNGHLFAFYIPDKMNLSICNRQMKIPNFRFGFIVFLNTFKFILFYSMGMTMLVMELSVVSLYWILWIHEFCLKLKPIFGSSAFVFNCLSLVTFKLVGPAYRICNWRTLPPNAGVDGGAVTVRMPSDDMLVTTSFTLKSSGKR